MECPRALARRGGTRAVNTQLNRLSMPDLAACSSLLIEPGAHGWQIQLTVPGRAADRPECCCSPTTCSSCFRARRSRNARCGRRQAVARQQHRLLRPYESLFAPRINKAARGHGVRAPGRAPGHRGRRRHQGLSVLADGGDWSGGNVREHSLRDIWERPGRSGTTAIARSPICGATARPATTPTNAGRAAPGRPRAASGSPATTRTATTARSSSKAAACASESSRRRRPPAFP